MIKRGMRVVFKPEWRDKGDDSYTFVAVSDEYHGVFNVSAVETTLFIRPWQVVEVRMVESAVPYLPVVTFRFGGLHREGAVVDMTRALGDDVMSVTSEVVARSSFRAMFRKFAKDCSIGEVLRQPVVEFPSRPNEEIRNGQA